MNKVVLKKYGIWMKRDQIAYGFQQFLCQLPDSYINMNQK